MLLNFGRRCSTPSRETIVIMLLRYADIKTTRIFFQQLHLRKGLDLEGEAVTEAV